MANEPAKNPATTAIQTMSMYHTPWASEGIMAGIGSRWC